MKAFLLSVFSILTFFFAQAQQDTCVYNIDTTQLSQNTEVELLKPWRYSVGDNPDWSKPDFDDSGWGKLGTRLYGDRLDLKLKKEGFKHTLWFRTTVCFGEDMLHKILALSVDNNGAITVFLNGKPIEQLGKFYTSGEADYRKQTIPALFTVNQTGKNVIAVKYENKDAFGKNFSEMDGFIIKIKESKRAISGQLSKIKAISVFSISSGFVFITLFFIHLLMFLFYRKDRSNLFFSLFSLGMGIFCLIFYSLVAFTQVRILNFVSYISVFSFILSAFSLSTLLNQLFGKFGWTYITVIVLTIVTSIAFLWFYDSSFFSVILAITLLFIVFESLFLIFRAIFKKQPGAKIIGTGISFFLLVCMVLIFYITYNQGLQINSDDNITAALFMSFLILFIFSIPFSLSAYLAWNFARTNKNLQQQIIVTKQIAQEKEHILESQNEILEQEVAQRTAEIKLEKQKSDDLLLNILPSEIAEELKTKGASKAQQYDEVSVLFTDFVNFTKISETLGVDELLNELNINFTAFDKIMEKHGLEKIKTIGDAYLAVSGIPITNTRHAQNAAMAALDILEFVEARKKEVPYGLDIRIGINSGALIAGIIGVKKFAYDIWGDTVNTAARMEQNSVAGKINISENTYQLLKAEFDCEHRGKIVAKGKGDMDMYFIKNIKTSYNADMVAFEKAKEAILDKLGKELPEHLYYHSVNHIKDVYNACEWIAKSEKVSEEDTTLLLTAALFHDSGFIYGAQNHEEKSCEIAQEYLPKYGYSQAQIDSIKGMIMATKIPQTPHNLLEQIIADADLDYLGRNDFFDIGNQLFKELMHSGVIKNEEEWNRLQVKFLENHHYFTNTSIQNRKSKKEHNLHLVKSKLQ